ncbi:hypothetical protein [Deinococcus cellulosilyticus]|uniref:Uncharacterized protein n=1 Tax=Deinococcus cellulosilyticus (strain DSM 18568 / NBRC 106333 / KACC 11606 / 5516J-15) TaxID=1223518 RepID=A0A511N7A7_DEIC1|nr:hypothetical protein [Deinococcus cellulosilyticus]GEM48346.1 hypothetical protein DC3_39810 [Deinococcus cellulosilyticus NBRC 106333 = KACC 11606]
MPQFYIREAGMLTVIEAAGPVEALSHYGHVHGWKLKPDWLQELREGVWSLFHGELMLFTEDPRPATSAPVLVSEDLHLTGRPQ